MKGIFILVTVHQNDGRDESVALIQSLNDLVARDGDLGLALGAALDLDVARFGQLAVDGPGQAGHVLMAEGALGVHHGARRFARPRPEPPRPPFNPIGLCAAAAGRQG